MSHRDLSTPQVETLLQDIKLGLAQGPGYVFASRHGFIKGRDQLRRGLIDAPLRRQDRPCAGLEEGADQADKPLSPAQGPRGLLRSRRR